MESPSFRWSRLASNPYPSQAFYLACADGRKALAKDATESAIGRVLGSGRTEGCRPVVTTERGPRRSGVAGITIGYPHYP